MASVTPLSPRFLWLHMNRLATLGSCLYCITFEWSAYDVSHKNQVPLCPQPFHLTGWYNKASYCTFCKISRQTPGIQRWLGHRPSLPGLYWLTTNSRHGNIMMHAWFMQWQSTIRTQYELKIIGDGFRFPGRWRRDAGGACRKLSAQRLGSQGQEGLIHITGRAMPCQAYEKSPH